jgi:hypothetical protein
MGKYAASVGLLSLGLLAPILAVAPSHVDITWAGAPKYSDPALEALLSAATVEFVRPAQYMGKWRLDRQGVRAVPNVAIKKALGF